MLLTITTTAPDATDLGYLLHKHPDRLHERDLGFGTARVFYPVAEPGRCTAALAVEVDAVGLARGSLRDDGYVTDRPYVAGSLLSVALSRTFNSALAGRAPERPDRVAEAMPLEATLAAVHLRGGESAVGRAFESLGYAVEVAWRQPGPRDPAWGEPRVATITLRGTATVRDLLRHLYILAPVVDGSKHYHVGADEVDKLLRHGSDWLADHPHKDWVVRRFLRFKAALARRALAALTVPDDDGEDTAEADVKAEAAEEVLETPVRLNDQRHAAVMAALRDPEVGIRSVADLGCGEGKMLLDLARVAQFDRIVGVDVSSFALDRAATRMERQHLPAHRRGAITLVQGSLVYRDDRLQGFDAVTLVEVIEHLDPGRLPALVRSVFGHARPRRVVVTTPNREYNVRWENLPAGRFRHRDHRFEWTRAEFAAWAHAVAAAHGYAVRFVPVGTLDPEVGPPTQMALFDREARP